MIKRYRISQYNNLLTHHVPRALRTKDVAREEQAKGRAQVVGKNGVVSGVSEVGP